MIKFTKVAGRIIASKRLIAASKELLLSQLEELSQPQNFSQINGSNRSRLDACFIWESAERILKLPEGYFEAVHHTLLRDEKQSKE